METRKLYYEDSHLSRFSARVLSCEKREGGFAVTLDATAFYPEGGGQAADTGTLGAVRVLHAAEEGDKVVHLCDGSLESGSTVEGVIDYDARFARMQQHSGEHIVSGIVHRRFGYHNTGFHMSSDRMVIDFDGVIDPQALAEIEAEANEAVWRNVTLRCWVPEPEKLEKLSYRTKRALPWPVRIVEIPGYDSCACCGTHVSATGEIGLVKIYSAVPFRGGTRIELACGVYALAMLNRIFAENRRVSRLLSAQITQTGDAAQQLCDQVSSQKFRINQLEKQVFAGIAEDFRDAGNVLYFAQGLSPDGIRELADTIASVCGGIAAVFSGSEVRWSYCLVVRDGDVRQLGKAMNASLQGRGGGKANFFQGSAAASREQIEAFFASAWEK